MDQTNRFLIMKKQNFLNVVLSFFIFVSIVSCSERTEEINIKGNWWFVKPDNTYNELYIRDSTFVLMLDDLGGPTFTFFYKITKIDTIDVYEEDELVNHVSFKYCPISDFFFFKLGEDWIHLQRINENINSYIDVKSNSPNIEFEKAISEFMDRQFKYMYNTKDKN